MERQLPATGLLSCHTTGRPVHPTTGVEEVLIANQISKILYGIFVASVALAAHAADCNISALNDAQKYDFAYRPVYFDVSKNYEISAPYTVKPGEQLIYRKIGRKNFYFVPTADITYKPDWLLSTTFRLSAGQKYWAEEGADKTVPLRAIRMQGSSAANLLYVDQEGALCERVASIALTGFNIKTIVAGKYVGTPADGQLQYREEVDSQYSNAVSVTLDEEGAALIKLTLNIFNAKGLVRTVARKFDKNAINDLLFEGWHFSLKKQPDGTYQATVLAQPA